jgi:hypothetical protein
MAGDTLLQVIQILRSGVLQAPEIPEYVHHLELAMQFQ